MRHVLRPLGSRILVRPDEPAPVSDVIAAPETAATAPYVSGVVVSVGDGSRRLSEARKAGFRACLDVIRDFDEDFDHPPALQVLHAEVSRLLRMPARESEIAVGMRVVFPTNAYLEVVVDGEVFLTLDEDAVAGVCEREDVAA